jgi:rhodanese-related sulfurtransferase
MATPREAVPRLAIVLGLMSSLAFAGGDTQEPWGAPPPLRETTVPEVAAWQQAKAMVPVDVNSGKVRASEGVIPGAVLLTSSAEYDLKELPTAKSTRLVFYCSRELCNASHQAARRALEAGYLNVSVLSAGIKGWKAAGHTTVKPTS